MSTEWKTNISKYLVRFSQNSDQIEVFKNGLLAFHRTYGEPRPVSPLCRAALGFRVGFPQEPLAKMKPDNRIKLGGSYNTPNFYLNREQGDYWLAWLGDRHDGKEIKQALHDYLAAQFGLAYPLENPRSQVNWDTLANRVRGERGRLGYTQATLAATLNRQYKLKLTEFHISQMETGHRSKPGMEVVRALANFFDFQAGIDY